MAKYLNRSELLETEYTSLKIKYKISDCLKLDTADRAQKTQDMCTRALASVSSIQSSVPAFRFSKWRRTNQNLTRHCGRCQAAVLALRIFQHR